MKNYEKYAEEIRELKSDIGIEWCELFAKPKVLKSLGRTCEYTSCGLCSALIMLWLLEDYKEPEVDWSKVEVDTPILVRNSEYATTSWLRRHFAKYENGLVYAWNNGETSWTTVAMTDWNYAKLAEDAKEDKEAETDWGKIKVNTPILVKDHEDGEWLKRYFAKYEDGYVYAWGNGCTSWNADNMYAWNYTKLVENEEIK